MSKPAVLRRYSPWLALGLALGLLFCGLFVGAELLWRRTAPSDAASQLSSDRAALASSSSQKQKAGSDASLPSSSPAPSSTAPAPEQHASVLFVGDVLFHSHMINGGRQDDGQYDYDFLFEPLKPWINGADWAICNMEGTLGGEPYTGYPLFSAPDAVARAMKLGGFDMVTAANNHSIDRRSAGVKRTKQVLLDAGLDVIGTRQQPEENTWRIVNINGIQVGFGAWTYETRRLDGQRSLNGIRMTDEEVDLLASFSLEEPYITYDYERIAKEVQTMREAGAECLVYVLHLGTEYSSTPDGYQKSLARHLAKLGVDVVFSCGPHVIQPIASLDRDGQFPDKDPMLCFYSVGNIVSDQLFDTDNNGGRAEDGLVAGVRFSRQPDGRIALSRAGYVATYCYKQTIGEARKHNQPIAVADAISKPEAVGVKAQDVALFEASQARTAKVMANNDVAFDFFKEWRQLGELFR